MLRKLLWMSVCIALLCAVSMSTTLSLVYAQSTLKLKQVQSLKDFVPAGTSGFLEVVHSAVLAPDGKRFATSEAGGLCLYTLDTKSRACTAWPTNFKGLPPLLWSPDSRYIAFTEDTFRHGLDSDIWVFDLTKNVITNRTDDGYYGGFFTASKITSTIYLDYQPTWDPANAAVLYFFRNVIDPKSPSRGKVGLYRFDLNQNEPVAVQVSLDGLPGEFPIFPRVTFVPLNGAAQISPDGKQMVVLVESNEVKNPANGIYTIDLKDGWVKFVMTSAEGFAQGLPDWVTEPPRIPTGVAWTNDGGIVFFAENGNFASDISRVADYVNPSSPNVLPLFDFKDIASRAALFRLDAQGNSPAARLPSIGAYLPRHDVLVTINGRPNVSPISINAVPLDGIANGKVPEPVNLGTIESFEALPANFVSVSTDETKVLIFGYLLTFE